MINVMIWLRGIVGSFVVIVYELICFNLIFFYGIMFLFKFLCVYVMYIVVGIFKFFVVFSGSILKFFLFFGFFLIVVF